MANASRREKLSAAFTGKTSPTSAYEARLILAEWASALSGTTKHNTGALVFGYSVAVATWGSDLAKHGGVPPLCIWGPSAVRIAVRAQHAAFGRPVRTRQLPASAKHLETLLLVHQQPAHAPVVYIEQQTNDLARARSELLFTDAILAANTIRANRADLADEMAAAYASALSYAEKVSPTHAMPLAIAMAGYRTCAGVQSAHFTDLFPDLRRSLTTARPATTPADAIFGAMINLVQEGELPGVTLTVHGMCVSNQKETVNNMINLITSGPTKLRHALIVHFKNLGLDITATKPTIIPPEAIPAHLAWRLGDIAVTDEQEPPVYRDSST